MTPESGPGPAEHSQARPEGLSPGSRELDQLFLLHSAALQAGEAVAPWWFGFRANAQDTDSEAALQELLQDALNGIAQALAADAVAVLLADETGELVVRVAVGMQPELFREVHIAVGAGMAGRVVAQRRPYVVRDLSKIEVVSETLRESGMRSLVAVPILGRDHVLGVLHADSSQMDYFDERHADLLSIVADRLAAALEQVRLFDAERTARTAAETLAGHLVRLQGFTAALSRDLSVDDLSGVVQSELSEDLDGGTVRPLVWVVEGKRLRLISGDREMQRPEVADYVEISLDEHLPGPQVVRSGEPLWFASRSEIEAGYEQLRDFELHTEALAVLPLVVEDQMLGALSVAYPTQRRFSQDEQLFLTLTAHQLAESLHRARIRQSRLRAAWANALLADVSAALASSMHLPTALRRALEELVPRLGTLAVVELRDERGVTRRAALVERQPAERSLLARTSDEPVVLADSRLSAAVGSTRHPVLVASPASLLDELTLDEAHGRHLAEAGLLSAVAVPLWARGEPVGVLGLVRLGGADPYAEDDLEVAAEIGDRVATAVGNATEHDRRVALARALQASLLPPALPDVPGAEVAAMFHAASVGVDVGGDFYDLFPVDDRRWVLMIGDVSGSGPAAAALTAQVRHGARVAARAGLDPASVLSAVNATLDETTGSEWFCTMVYVELTAGDDGIDLQLICAGHVPPVVLSEGRAQDLGCQSPLLGVLAAASYSAIARHLAPGETLVLVTDGATEARPPGRRDADAFFGEERVREVLEGCAGSDAETMVQALADAVLEHSGDQLDDDMAVVALRAVPQKRDQ